MSGIHIGLVPPGQMNMNSAAATPAAKEFFLNAQGTQAEDVPGWMAEFRRPASTNDRIIVDFKPRRMCFSFCYKNSEYVPEQAMVVPSQLAAKGISQEIWTKWMNRLNHEMSRTSLPLVCVVLIFHLPIFIPYFCSRNNELQRSLISFMKDINEELLEPKGMYLKFQQSVLQGDSGKGQVFWISISLNPNESEILKAEDFMFTYDMKTKLHKCDRQRDLTPNCCEKLCCCSQIQIIAC